VPYLSHVAAPDADGAVFSVQRFVELTSSVSVTQEMLARVAATTARQST
jgi:hypothetical protein